MFSPEWLAALSGILLLDLLLSGDNAILIALACKNLPHEMRRKAIIVGGLGLTQAGLAFRVRPAPGWGWLMLARLASFLIAVALLLRFPFSITESPGVMAGMSLIFGGLAYAMVGLGRRKRLSSEAS